MRRSILQGPAIILATAATLAPSAVAQNAAFQDFFFSACNSPTGSLAARCAETPNGEGDLSSNSETSLNPNQTLSSNQTPLGNARNQISRTEERLAGVGGSADGTAINIGPFSLLVNGGYATIEQDDTDSERGFDGDVYSIELGVDKRLNDTTVIGGFIGYETTEFDYDREAEGVNFTPQSNSGTTESTAYSLVLFGAFDIADNLYAEGSAGLSRSEYEFQRNVVFQESTRSVEQTNVQVQGDPDGDAYWFSGSLGYRLDSGAWSHTPYARATYVKSDIDAYTESDLNNSGLAMRVDSNERESLTTTFGVRSSYAMSTDWGVIVPSLHLAYEHEFDQDAQVATSSFDLDTAQNQYTIEGDDPDRDYFIAGAGVSAIFAEGWMLFLNYDGLVGHDERERHQLTAGLRREF